MPGSTKLHDKLLADGIDAIGGMKVTKRTTSRSLSLALVLSDPHLFISRLKVKSKSGKLISLTPTSEQIQIIDAFIGSEDHLVILKPRQIGSSTIALAILFWKWYTSSEPISIAILSHKLASSKHLLTIWFRFYDNLPQELQRPLSYRTTTNMKFRDTGAEVVAVSGAADGGLRSFSANYIHLSEYAFADDAEELKATALASLNEGRLIQESTANFWGDAHHIDVLRAERGEGNLKLLFFPWSEHSEYTYKGTLKEWQKKKYRPDPGNKPHDSGNKPDAQNDPNGLLTDGAGLLPDYDGVLPDSDAAPEEITPGSKYIDKVWVSSEEQDLMAKHGLNVRQLLWRRLKIQQFGLHKFRREYPLTIDDAYGATSNAYFKDDDLANIDTVMIDMTADAINIIEEPRKEATYAIGIDVATGCGQDYSAIVVLDKVTWRQVAVWSSNTTAVPATADMVEHLSAMYHNALCLVEENNIGYALLLELRNRGFNKLWQHPTTGKDWNTNGKTKWLMFEELKETLASGAISQLDIATFQQLKQFVINSKGNIDVAHKNGHGDSVIALALAVQCLKQVPFPKTLFLPAWVRSQKYSKAVKKLTLKSKQRYGV